LQQAEGDCAMLIGYARVSTKEQNEARQIRYFEELGVEKYFLDKESGKDANREGLKEMLSFIREGDTVVVESISRIARNTKDLLSIVEKIKAKGANFISKHESIDTTTPQGQFMLTIFGAMAQLERECIIQRQQEGIAIAREEGRYAGKPRMNIDEDKLRAECEKWREGKQTAAAAMRTLKLKPNTFYRRVKELGL